MFDRDELFIRTLDDLKQKLGQQDPYELMMTAALLRKLLFDDDPLLFQVNRERRLRIEFEVGKPMTLPPGIPEPTVWTLQDGLDPETSLSANGTVRLNKSQFEGFTIEKAGDKTHSVREVVLFLSNVVGAVHAGKSKSNKEKVFEDVNKMLMVGGYPSSLRQVLAIGRVTLRALDPLRTAILTERATRSQTG